MRKIFLFTSVIIIITTLPCCNLFTSPENIKSVRDYTWDIDTLRYPRSQIFMSAIWASSPENVWVCGHSSSGYANLWHYDGNSWTYIDLFEYIERGPITFSWITGFDEDNVWVVGDRNLSYYEYNGNRITKYKSIAIELRNGIWIEHDLEGLALYDIWGTSRNDIWTCGNGGYIFHYNGQSWQKDSIKVAGMTDPYDFQLKSIKQFEGKYYTQGIKWDNISGNHIEYFFERVENEWTIVDSFMVTNPPKWGGLHFVISDYGKMYSYGRGGVFQFENGEWTNILHPYTIRGLSSISEKNMICGGDNGNVYHFNGSDWTEIELQSENFLYPFAFWMFENQVFIVNYYFLETDYVTLIYRGK